MRKTGHACPPTLTPQTCARAGEQRWGRRWRVRGVRDTAVRAIRAGFERRCERAVGAAEGRERERERLRLGRELGGGGGGLTAAVAWVWRGRSPYDRDEHSGDRLEQERCEEDDEDALPLALEDIDRLPRRARHRALPRRREETRARDRVGGRRLASRARAARIAARSRGCPRRRRARVSRAVAKRARREPAARGAGRRWRRMPR
eukprot:2331748-Prymnesium_polylepis.1